MLGGVYRGMRSFQAEESISEVREVKVEAIVMGSEKDSSVKTGWILERESGRGELTRMKSAVMEETEEEQVEDMLWSLRERVYWREVEERENTGGWSFL